MPRNYIHLTPQDRAVIMLMRDDQCSIRSIAKFNDALLFGDEISRDQYLTGKNPKQ